MESPTAQDRFPEWLALTVDQPVRQGDILKALHLESDPWRRLLVVITADCDLAKDKHGGALTCIPVLDAEHYLMSFRFEKLRNGLVDKLISRALHQLSQQRGEAGAIKVSAHRMRQWLVEEQVSDIIASLPGPSPEAFEADAQVCRDLLCERPRNLTDGIALLARVKVALGEAKDQERATRSVGSDIVASLRTLPGDALFLNELSPAHDAGYVAYLRRVLEVHVSEVAVSMSRLPHQSRYLRTSRLRSPYLYALTSKFASVFTAIGLPAEYESARDALALRMTAGEES